MVLFSGMISCDISHEVLLPDSFTSDDPTFAIIVKQQSDSLSIDIAGQLSKSFDYTKIPVNTHDIDLFGSDFVIPASVRVICLTVSDIESFPDAQIMKLIDFVAAGNTLFVTHPLFDDRFNFLTGIRKDAQYQTASGAAGFRFNERVFPNYQGKFKLRFPFYHSNLSKKVFKPEVEVIAESYDPLKEPIITRHRIGKGQSIMFNSEIGYDKLYRGLLFSIILSSLEGVAYPVANVSTIFLDDFPLPLYNQMRAPVDWEYNVTEEEFVSNIWWPDMQALADTFDIDYTAALAFNYNANVVPPFDFQEWKASDVYIEGVDRTGSIGLAQSVVQSRHELAFHGYNHFSLWLNDWSNQDFMMSALRAARKRWQIDNLGLLPVTYIPPTNIIDSTGIEALTTAMPNIKYMSSLYLGDVEDGSGREFSTEPYTSELYNYPRISSGFFVNEENLYTMQSLYLLTGIWTHFVHPDDIFQISQVRIFGKYHFAPRNELLLGWHKSRNYDYGLYEAFRNHLVYMEQTYPLTRYKAAKDAVPEVKQWNDLQLKREEGKNFSYITTLNKKNSTSWWFVYVDKSNMSRLEQYINRYADEYVKTPFWNGELIQFSTERDSLALPILRSDSFQSNPGIHAQYHAFITEEYDHSTQAADSNWQDTRFNNAMAELEENPDSRELQEEVINLAVEFEKVSVAIGILEKRLAKQNDWKNEDIDRLLTYYGWEGASEQAYNFLEQLWNRYHSDRIVKLKDMMVARYGTPSEDFSNQWLKRQIMLDPGNDQILRRLIVNNQSAEQWPETKSYLKQAIEQNPDSDSLYLYTLQQSFYYDKPQETFSLIESFPEHATIQLEPLYTQIAEAYAYSINNYSKALHWSNRIKNFPPQRKLEWLLQQKRFNAFMEEGDRAIMEETESDSLRALVGQQLIYNGFYDEGYSQIYPLFETGNASSTVRSMVHNEIGYRSYTHQKQLYRQYPAFFSDSLQSNLQHQYRFREGSQLIAVSDYASDNFDNTIAHWGAFFEWGDRQNNTHRITANEQLVGSEAGNDNLQKLWHATYQFRDRLNEDNIQFTAGGGFFLEEKVKPDLLVSAGYGKASTYTSAELTYRPEFTIMALRQDINKINLALYHENYFRKGKLQGTLFLNGKYYTNNVTAFEMTGRVFYKLPFANDFRGVTELSHSNASKIFESGNPFFTPDNLFIQGLGAKYQFPSELSNTDLEAELEMLVKNDNDNGIYVVSSARINKRLKKYWQVSINANISSSAVYRYNRMALTLSYLLPRELQSGLP